MTSENKNEPSALIGTETDRMPDRSNETSKPVSHALREKGKKGETQEEEKEEKEEKRKGKKWWWGWGAQNRGLTCT
jgi:hypothetical protein